MERIVYSNVRHLELWWNLSKSLQSECLRLESIHCYAIENNVYDRIHPEICQLLQNQSLKHFYYRSELSDKTDSICFSFS